MIGNAGLQKYRDACGDEVDTGIAGTGTTAPAENDTALETAVSATESSAVVTKSTNSFQVSHTILSTVAAGTSFTEWGILASDDTLLSRSVTAAVSHTSNDEVIKLTTVNLVNR